MIGRFSRVRGGFVVTAAQPYLAVARMLHRRKWSHKINSHISLYNVTTDECIAISFTDYSDIHVLRLNSSKASCCDVLR